MDLRGLPGLAPRGDDRMSESGIDKAGLLREVIAQVEETLRRLESGYAVAKQATLDSPHVMKSKREVTGIESSYLANGLAQKIQERQGWLRTLQKLDLPNVPTQAALGCVVGVGPSEGGPVESLYFILPVCGGMEIPVDDRKRIVRVVTPGSPVAGELIGKALGDEVQLLKGHAQRGSIGLLL